MKLKNNLASLIFQDFDGRYYIELLLLITISLTVYYSYIQFLSMSPHLNYSYPEMRISYFFNRYLLNSSYPLFTVFYILIIVVSSYEIFLFSSAIMKNKFIAIYSMGYKKNYIVLSYFTMFVMYPLFLLCISCFLISYIDFLSIQWYILDRLLLFTCVNLIFFISIGFLLAVSTKNSLIPSAFIIVFFYLLIPFAYIRPENTIIYHLFYSMNAYLNFGLNGIAIQAIIIEFLLSIILLVLAMLIANYRDMKVIR